MSEDRKKKLEALNKKYNSSFKEEQLEVIPTGSLTLDKATGIGGIPVGKIVEIYGPESSGKSTLVLEIIAQAQKMEKFCCLVDFENSFDAKYAEALGVNIKDLDIQQPDSMEDGYNFITDAIDGELFDLIVLDSHTAAIPRKLIENKIGDATMAIQARFNSQFLGVIKTPLNKKGITLLAVSQLRTNIGGYGDPNVPTGGQGWKFYSDMRIKTQRQLDKENELNKTKATIIKNKCSKPFGVAEFNIDWGKGIDTMQEIMDLSIEAGLLKKGGAWYTLEDGSKIQGDNGMKKYFKDNPDFYSEILTKLNETESKEEEL